MKSNKSDKKTAKKEAIIESLAGNCSITSACKSAGISRETFYYWYRDDEKFKENIESAQLSRINIVEDSLYESALKGNITAQIFFLCNRAPEKWQNVNKIEHPASEKEVVRYIIEHDYNGEKEETTKNN